MNKISNFKELDNEKSVNVNKQKLKENLII